MALPYITGMSADGTYFVDQNNNPRMMVNEDIWNIMFQAGRYSGDYQGDLTGYFAARSAQGYTSAEMSAYGNDDGSGTMIYKDGRDWDGTWPFTSTNDPSSGMNEAFWAKRDFLFATAASYGMSVVMTVTGPLGSATLPANNPAWSWTTQQFTDYGTALGTRYASTPNILWTWGDEINDYFNVQMEAFYVAIRATGDAHAWTVQNGYPTTSRQNLPVGSGALPSSFGPSHAQFNWCYDYCQSYNSVIPAAQESTATGYNGTIPCIWGDGYYIDTGTTGGISNKFLERMNIWWALSSGARGFSTGDGPIYTWVSGALAAVTANPSPEVGNFYVAQIPAITSTFSSLTGWHKLYPDATSALVTSGRGTFTPAGNFYYTDNSDGYTTAAKTPDGSLAVIYLPKPGTITINQSVMSPGYGANWIDPASGAKTAATPGTTYNSTPLGTNSDGDPDWVLVLQSPPYATWQVP